MPGEEEAKPRPPYIFLTVKETLGEATKMLHRQRQSNEMKPRQEYKVRRSQRSREWCNKATKQQERPRLND